MSKQLFFKLRGDKLLPLNSKDEEYFKENIAVDTEDIASGLFRDEPDEDVIVSFAYDKKENDIIVYVWTSQYSIALSYNEFMVIHSLIKDKENLITKIISKEI